MSRMISVCTCCICSSGDLTEYYTIFQELFLILPNKGGWGTDIITEVLIWNWPYTLSHVKFLKLSKTKLIFWFESSFLDFPVFVVYLMSLMGASCDKHLPDASACLALRAGYGYGFMMLLAFFFFFFFFLFLFHLMCNLMYDAVFADSDI